LSVSGLDVNSTTINSGETVLHLLCNGNLYEGLFCFFIEKGADPQNKNKEGKNVLHLLCREIGCVDEEGEEEIMFIMYSYIQSMVCRWQ